MVTPITTGVTPAAGPVLLAGIERPVAQPDPAVKVTQSNGTEMGGNSTQSEQAAKNTVTDPANPFEDALNKVNESMQAWDTGIRFEIDEDTESMVVKLVNNETGDVIRQVPSEAMLKVAKMIIQMQGGSINTQA